MAKKLVSFLGTTLYEKMTYSLHGKTSEAIFIQEAMIDLLCQDFDAEDSVIILETDAAKKKNGEELERLLTVKKSMGAFEGNLVFKPIPEEKGEAGVWQLFQIIFNDVLEENDSVMFDITNGFRYLPVVMFSVLNYAQYLKNVETHGIYYAAFEQREGTIEPVIDLTKTYELMNWAAAANSFTSYGIADQLSKQIRKQDQEFKDATTLADSIVDMTDNLNYSRGKKIMDAAVFNICIKKIKEYGNTDDMMQNPVLKPILDKVVDKINDFKPQNAFNFIPATQWYIDHHMPAEAISMLKEGIITYLLEKKGLDYRSFQLRAVLGSRLAYSGNTFTYQINQSPFEQAVETIMATDEAKVLKTIVEEFATIRNDIDHCGYNKDANQPEELEKKIKDSFNQVKILMAPDT